MGSEVAELLARNFNSVDEISQASEEELTAVAGIGPKIAESIAAYFQDSANRQVVARLQGSGVHLEQEPAEPAGDRDAPFAGLTFVVTGTLATLSRSEAGSRIKTRGGKITASVTRNTDYVVVGASPGSKAATAEQLGTPVLDEDAFLQLLESPPVRSAG